MTGVTFGALDAAMMRAGVAVAISGLLLVALGGGTALLGLAGAMALAGGAIAAIGAWGCRRSQTLGPSRTPQTVPHEGKGL